MSYRYDPDLQFLSNLSRKELEPLARVLIYDTDGAKRWTENLSSKKYYNWQDIAEEYQKFAGNSLINWYRGGILYKESLREVCDQMKVSYNKHTSVETLELKLLVQVMEEAMKKMSEAELRKITKELNLNTTNFTPEAITAALQLGINLSGFAVYKIAVTVLHSIAEAFGMTLSFATYCAVTRTISIFAGPIGWLVTAVWTTIDIAGPAYRVTIPATIVIACLRRINQQKELPEEISTERTEEPFKMHSLTNIQERMLEVLLREDYGVWLTNLALILRCTVKEVESASDALISYRYVVYENSKYIITANGRHFLTEKKKIKEEFEDRQKQATVEGRQLCPHCGYLNPPKYKGNWCTKCNGQLVESQVDAEKEVLSTERPKCSSCGSSIPNGPDAKFCIECGAKLHRENKCPKCSTIMPDGAKFCSECGTKLV